MIKKIQIKNYKSLVDVTLDCSELNVIIGMNGVGKSSFIQTLLLLRQSYLNKYLPSKGLILRDNNLINVGTAKSVIAEDRIEDDVIEFIITSGENSYAWAFDFELLKGDTDNTSAHYVPLKENQEAINADVVNLLYSNNLLYLCAERIAPKLHYKLPNYEVTNYVDIKKNGENIFQYIDYHIKKKTQVNLILRHEKAIRFDAIDVDETNPIENTNYKENLNLWLSEISNGVKISTTFLADLGIVSAAASFERNGNSDTQAFSLPNIGFGITYVLPIIATLLVAKEGDTIIIENPEAHLHGAGQEVLGKLIAKVASIGVQVFIETHSEHFINGIFNDTFDPKIFYFHRDNNSSEHTTQVEVITAENKDTNKDYINFLCTASNEQLRLKREIKQYKDLEKNIIITEGKTDWEHFKKAYQILIAQEKVKELNIEFLELTENLGDKDLQKMLKHYSKKANFHKIIGVFDRDGNNINRHGENLFLNLGENVFSLCLPIPEHRSELTEICIELYYTDEDLEKTDINGRRIFQTTEFHAQSGRHKSNPNICVNNRKSKPMITDEGVFELLDNGTEKSIALSKNQFKECICEEKEGFKDINFDGFIPFFNVIEEILNQQILTL